MLRDEQSGENMMRYKFQENQSKINLTNID